MHTNPPATSTPVTRDCTHATSALPCTTRKPGNSPCANPVAGWYLQHELTIPQLRQPPNALNAGMQPQGYHKCICTKRRHPDLLTHRNDYVMHRKAQVARAATVGDRDILVLMQDITRPTNKRSKPPSNHHTPPCMQATHVCSVLDTTHPLNPVIEPTRQEEVPRRLSEAAPTS